MPHGFTQGDNCLYKHKHKGGNYIRWICEDCSLARVVIQGFKEAEGVIDKMFNKLGV